MDKANAAHNSSDDLPIDTSRALAIALLRARENVMARFRQSLKTLDVTEQQWRVLRVVAEHDTIDAGQLGAEACILAPSLTRIIRSLERRKLLVAQRDQDDGRRLLMSLTPQGEAMIRELAPAARRIYADIEARLGYDKLQQLLDQLNTLAALPRGDDGDGAGDAPPVIGGAPNGLHRPPAPGPHAD